GVGGSPPSAARLPAATGAAAAARPLQWRAGMPASRTSLLASALALAVGALPSSGRAQEPWMLALEGSAAIPVTAPQSALFEPGASAAATVWGSLSSAFALGGRVRGALLADGPAPEDPTLADPEVGSVLSLGVGARLRLEAAWDDSPRRATGPWIDAFGAAVLTGAVLRPGLEV